MRGEARRDVSNVGRQTGDRRLHARYNRAIDTGQAEAWADCFTQDGVFDARTRYAKGTAELIDFARFYHQEPTFKGAVHWNANIVIDGDGDEADVHADFALIRSEPSGGRIMSTGSYAFARAQGQRRVGVSPYASRRSVARPTNCSRHSRAEPWGRRRQQVVGAMGVGLLKGVDVIECGDGSAVAFCGHLLHQLERTSRSSPRMGQRISRPC